MSKVNQEVRLVFNASTEAYIGQVITDIVVSTREYAFGYWRGYRVASFHIDSDRWFVL